MYSLTKREVWNGPKFFYGQFRTHQVCQVRRAVIEEEQRAIACPQTCTEGTEVRSKDTQDDVDRSGV
jgi:hypothetical protein